MQGQRCIDCEAMIESQTCKTLSCAKMGRVRHITDQKVQVNRLGEQEVL